MVKLLVSRGAEICNEQTCGVAAAAEGGSLELLQLLFDRSAETACLHNNALHKGMDSYT